jgi:hypothetical protein
MVVVEFALEAVEHVVNVAEAVLLQVLAGFLRAISRAADQDHRAMVRGGHANLAEEMRVQIPVDALVPGDQDGADRVADEKKFEFRAAINQDSVGLFLNEVVSLFRGQVFQGDLLA